MRCNLIDSVKQSLNVRFLASLLLVSLIVTDSLGVNDVLLEKLVRRYGPEAEVRLQHWQELLLDDSAQTELGKLERVNFFINQLQFLSDKEHWGKDDYWATPLEFIASNGGDCEDFAVAKYFALKSMGVADERMQLTYVKSLRLNQAHMVLTYYPTPDADPLVLDNLDREIKPASRRNDLLPVYGFNGKGLWIAKERGHGRLVGNSNRLSRWNQLIDRISHE